MKEPLPCPFCGGEVAPYRIGKRYYLQCYNDDCEVNPRIDRPHATEEGVIAAWNKRTINTIEPLDAN